MPPSYWHRSWSWFAGFRLLGPHFYYDVVRLARRGRSTLLRVVYLFVLLGGLAWVYQDTTGLQTRFDNEININAGIAERFTFTLFFTQNLALLLLTPAYLASAIAEEKERRTLELLFTTQLSDAEIVLGKLGSRVIHLFGFVIAGVPVLSLVQFWGGVDLALIAGNLANTLLNVLTIGSVCLLMSSLCKTVTGAVTVSYAIVLPTYFCCAGAANGFPFVLQDARQGGNEMMVAIQNLVGITVVHLVISILCLAFAMVAVRAHEVEEYPLAPRTSSGSTAPMPAEIAMALQVAASMPRNEGPQDLFSFPYALPPVTDNALWWKEQHQGGPPPLFSPIILVAVGPMLGVGVPVVVLASIATFFEQRGQREQLIEEWSGAFLFFYCLFLGLYALGVAYRSAASVARERQQQTLEPLLLLPIDRRDILQAKLYGILLRGWPWLALIGVTVAFGVLVGAFHPFSAVLLCLAPWPLIFFIATLGLMLSVVMQTVLRANLAILAVIFILLIVGVFWPLNVGTTPFYFHLAFSMRRVPTLTDLPAFLGTPIACILFAAAAYACWQIAVALFENRRQGKTMEIFY